MFAMQDRCDDVEVAFTDRHGGVSGGTFASLNLARGGDDDPDRVETNHRIVAESFTGDRPAPPLHSMIQVHGCHVAVVGGDDRAATDEGVAAGAGGGAGPVESDGLVTAAPGAVLMVRAADCVPVVLGDPEAGVVGVVHAGRRGLVAGVVAATVARMADLGAEHLVAWVGPHVCARCYEVPGTMQDEVAAAVHGVRATSWWGTPSLDLGAGVRAQLLSAGVGDLRGPARCTVEDDDLFSFRRQGAGSGRLAGLVWLRP